MKKITLLLSTLLVAISMMAQYQPSLANLQSRAEFRGMKYGIFIHWGLYSVLGHGEWYTIP